MLSLNENQNEQNKPYICDVVRHPNFQNYELFLEELLKRKQELVFRKPSLNDEFSKDIRYKIGYRDAIKDIITLNEEAKNYE
jgi:hypothetical protein